MKSFTYASPEAIQEMIAEVARLDGSYDMSLNHADTVTLIRALWYTHGSASATLGDRAGALLSTIAETLGIEFV